MRGEKKGSNQVQTRYAVRLFVAGDATNSRIARENLKRLRDKFPEDGFTVEIVDVNVCPEVALEEGVFITPALKVIEPAPGGIVYGNLSDFRALGQLFPDAD